MRKVFTASVFALFGLMAVPASAMPFPSLNDEASGVTPLDGRVDPTEVAILGSAMALPRRACTGPTAIIPTRTPMATTHTRTDTAIIHTRTDTAIITTTIADICGATKHPTT